MFDVLTWQGKAEALKCLSSPLSKKLLLLSDESTDTKSTKNLFIEGDNLEALRLLKGKYRGKVKLIYTDPPYNTGNTFTYSDNLRGRGKVCARSKWLNMLYPRFTLARYLLKSDGVMFVSIGEDGLVAKVTVNPI